MPRWTGVSHAIAAVVVLFVGPLISRLIEILITARDIETTIESLATVINSHPLIPLKTDMTTSVLYIAVIAVLAFIWGYAYHVQRH
jgi:hypothetical protein